MKLQNNQFRAGHCHQRGQKESGKQGSTGEVGKGREVNLNGKNPVSGGRDSPGSVLLPEGFSSLQGGWGICREKDGATLGKRENKQAILD